MSIFQKNEIFLVPIKFTEEELEYLGKLIEKSKTNELKKTILFKLDILYKDIILRKLTMESENYGNSTSE